MVRIGRMTAASESSHKVKRSVERTFDRGCHRFHEGYTSREFQGATSIKVLPSFSTSRSSSSSSFTSCWR